MKATCLECGAEFHDHHEESAETSLKYHIKTKHPEEADDE